MEVNIMRIGEYLEIGNKMKTARINATINQKFIYFYRYNKRG